jgi:hypothetical protein
MPRRLIILGVFPLTCGNIQNKFTILGQMKEKRGQKALFV